MGEQLEEGCVLLGMHFSQSKNARLLNYRKFIVFRYLRDESGLNRKNIVDNRVHCCFYFINPYGHGLKPLDIEVMKQLSNKVCRKMFYSLIYLSSRIKDSRKQESIFDTFLLPYSSIRYIYILTFVSKSKIENTIHNKFLRVANSNLILAR